MKKIKRMLALVLAAIVMISAFAVPAFAQGDTESRNTINISDIDTPNEGVVQRGPVSPYVIPDVTLSPISNRIKGTPVTVSGSASNPCYRMAAKYQINGGADKWLGEVMSNSFTTSFTPTVAGTYTVTLYARSYSENDSRSGQGSKSVTFTVYSGKVTPTVTLPTISEKKVGTTVTVRGSASSPCYRMAAKYQINGGADKWLGEVMSNSFTISFTPAVAGTYTVTFYARSYPENDVRSAQGSKSVTFYVSQPTQKDKQGKIDEEYFMAVPENGLLNHFAIKAVYTEKYTPSGSNAIFNNRSVWYEMKQMTNGTADFIYSVRLPSHVTDWKAPTNGSIFDAGWDYYGERVSTTPITYPVTTAASGICYLSITSYPTAINPYASNIQISFNTQN